MKPDRWKRTEELYHAAFARPPAERGTFLEKVCLDDEPLRRDVESLLRESSSDDGFLAEPPLVLPPHLLNELAPAAMSGRSLSGYELETLLGVGGMGEVYRAHDPKLGRHVAIKILPFAFTSHPDRLARFEREARMLAALNHPNICGIYGLEEAEGIRFLILELVDGETLAEKLAGVARAQAGPEGLPFTEVQAIGRQIVEALEVAHEKGIIHRDLKPANIKITPEGVVKVLDFGLAKTVSGNDSRVDLTHAPEPAPGGGREGAVIGTAAYMSPEQARGLPVDKRTDIWAFGCVLYEMLTGRVAFAGETISDSIAKILEREPDWSALPVTTPLPTRRLLLRVLTKDPKKRLRDIGDVRIEFDAIDETVPTIIGVTLPTRARPPYSLPPWVALAAFAVGVGAWEFGRPAMIGEKPIASTASPLADAVFTQLTDWPGTEEGAEISPDGHSVVFLADKSGEFDLWRTEVNTGDLRNLTQAMAPLDAPGILRASGFFGDGSEVWIGGLARPTIRVPHTGGTARPFLGDKARTPSWSPDGSRVAYFMLGNGDPLFLADRTLTDAEPITIEWPDPADSQAHNHNPVWSPDNQWIYFVHGSVRAWNHVTDDMDIWRVAPSGGIPERMTHLNTGVTFLTALDSRTLLYVAPAADGSGPWLWWLDVAERVPRRATIGLERYTSVSASGDGRRIAVTRANPTASLWTVPILERRTGEQDVQPYAVQTARARAPRFGGSSSLFYLSSRGSGDGLWRMQDGKSVEVLNGADGPVFDPPSPSPDGRRLAVVRKREGKQRLTVMWSNGTDLRTLAPSIDIHGTADWSPDGKWLAAGGKDAEGRLGLFKIPVDGGDPVRLVDAEAVNPVWSPGGNLIVYGGSFAAGQVQLLGVRPDRTPVQMPPVRVAPGGYRFRNRTQLVYLPRPESRDFWLVDLVTTAGHQLTALANQGAIRGFDITPDGTQIVFDRLRQNSDLGLIQLPKR